MTFEAHLTHSYQGILHVKPGYATLKKFLFKNNFILKALKYYKYIRPYLPLKQTKR